MFGQPRGDALALIGVGYSAFFVDGVAPVVDVVHSWEEGVVHGVETFLELGIEVGA